MEVADNASRGRGILAAHAQARTERIRTGGGRSVRSRSTPPAPRTSASPTASTVARGEPPSAPGAHEAGAAAAPRGAAAVPARAAAVRVAVFPRVDAALRFHTGHCPDVRGPPCSELRSGRSTASSLRSRLRSDRRYCQRGRVRRDRQQGSLKRSLFPTLETGVERRSPLTARRATDDARAAAPAGGDPVLLLVAPCGHTKSSPGVFRCRRRASDGTGPAPPRRARPVPLRARQMPWPLQRGTTPSSGTDSGSWRRDRRKRSTRKEGGHG